MIATLVIGLREGLEATLIVGIIAAFLRRNRAPLAPMWAGVGLAVALSIAVGFGLQLVEQALPQAQQEGMETVIGAVAVVFVTGMIVWMRTHARTLSRDLQASASAALGRGTAWALAGMAFLAVLKEGFETSVFLLATFQASSDTGTAAVGAVIGIAVAVAVGYGIYTGGVRLDLGRFFTGTGVFLVFVAGGLVLTALRHAHEAGWLVIGQQRTVDLGWLAPNGSLRGALVTGVLGIPADPRVIEVLGWFLYVVPVLAVAVWPRRWRPSPARVPVVRAAVAAGLAATAVVLALVVPSTDVDLPRTTAVTGDARSVTADVDGPAAVLRVSGTGREARRTLPASAHRRVTRSGVAADRWQVTEDVPVAGRPTSLTLDDLVGLFGRVPVGISPSTDPGPFTARWSVRETVTLTTVGGGVLDATRSERDVLTLRGGGLPAARTTTLERTVWAVPTDRVDRAAADLAAAHTRAAELRLWSTWLPIALAVAAAAQALLALRDRRRAVAPPTTTPGTDPSRGPPADVPARSLDHAVR
ncbi:FTR1 family protein [Curtobacterium sp. ODYSSEY 48 V2]|uniref:iron uptake transporter permease EfeU n=1 Tax=unclassified Curtobacterium TaxID=257496 RepID=UPI001AE0F620|nr:MULTISPECIES: iron uptake transporter permease EfeU [unclassified Curtobacterium]MBP1302800.1 high-affinity iron transporter [Curtobacterium sp. 1310]MCM3504156.1 FTR1 family protein [Curtobacterium sp. ODYSSEY 48 V2]MDB6427990.1 FTR1 family protein [Curtobacterium sp. 20TX0008]